MEIGEIVASVLQYGGTVIMAGLFVWVFIQDRSKSAKMLEDNSKMLQALAESNQNIAKSLDIISNNLLTIDRKVDRNYEASMVGARQDRTE